KNPSFTEFLVTPDVINEAFTGEQVDMTFLFSEPMMENTLDISFLSGGFTVEAVSGEATAEWTADSLYSLSTTALDFDEELEFIAASISSITDAHNNVTINPALSALTHIDTRAPEVIALANVYDVTIENADEEGFQINLIFDELMDESITPLISFPLENPSASITLNPEGSGWLGSVYTAHYDVATNLTPLPSIDIEISNATDSYGNSMLPVTFVDFFSIDLDTYLSVATQNHSEFSIYPNPVRSGEMVQISTAGRLIETLEVLNVQGAIVYKQAELDTSNYLFIPTIGMAEGNYFIKITNERGILIHKLQVLD
ncbi:MAG: T9SS type A sorting domain-containing protein, partial [Flavobacteriales bacterium]